MTNASRHTTYAAIEALVLDTVAATARVERRALGPSTPLFEVCVDSLTLIAVLTQIELACGVSFHDDELLELVRALDLGSLVAAVARMVAAARATESR